MDNEVLFWNIYRNKYLNNKIFEFINQINWSLFNYNNNFDNYNLDYYLINNVECKLKFKNINSFHFMVRNRLFSLLLSKIKANETISSISDISIHEFIIEFNKSFSSGNKDEHSVMPEIYNKIQRDWIKVYYGKDFQKRVIELCCTNNLSNVLKFLTSDPYNMKIEKNQISKCIGYREMVIIILKYYIKRNKFSKLSSGEIKKIKSLYSQIPTICKLLELYISKDKKRVLASNIDQLDEKVIINSDDGCKEFSGKSLEQVNIMLERFGYISTKEDIDHLFKLDFNLVKKEVFYVQDFKVAEYFDLKIKEFNSISNNGNVNKYTMVILYYDLELLKRKESLSSFNLREISLYHSFNKSMNNKDFIELFQYLNSIKNRIETQDYKKSVYGMINSGVDTSNVKVDFGFIKKWELRIFSSVINSCSINGFKLFFDNCSENIKRIEFEKDSYDIIIEKYFSVYYTDETKFNQTQAMEVLDYLIGQFQERDQSYQWLITNLINIYFGKLIAFRNLKIQHLVTYHDKLTKSGVPIRHILYHSFHYLRTKSIKVFKYLLQRPYIFYVGGSSSNGVQRSFPPEYYSANNLPLVPVEQIYFDFQKEEESEYNYSIESPLNFKVVEDDNIVEGFYNQINVDSYDFKKYFKSSKYTFSYIINSKDDKLLESLIQDISVNSIQEMRSKYPKYQTVCLLHDFRYYLEVNRIDLFFSKLESLKSQTPDDNMVSIFYFLLDGDETFQEVENRFLLGVHNKPKWVYHSISIISMIIRVMDIESINRIFSICSAVKQHLVKVFIEGAIQESRLDLIKYIIKNHCNYSKTSTTDKTLLIHKFRIDELYKHHTPKSKFIQPFNQRQLIEQYLTKKKLIDFNK